MDYPISDDRDHLIEADSYRSRQRPRCFSTYTMEGLAFDLSTLTRDKLQGVGFGLSSEIVHITGTNVVAKISGPQDLED